MNVRVTISSAFLVAGCLAAAGLAGCAKMPTSAERTATRSYLGQAADAAFVNREGSDSIQRPILASAGINDLWIVARSSDAEPAHGGETPGSGTLLAKVQGQEVPMPLKHTSVRATINGYIGSVEVAQQFLNPYSGKIEAIYEFPLPHNAAINEFVMTIGGRRIRGIIRERKEAEQIYQQAKTQGYRASLLTEERPNVFTQSVANIEPGHEIDVTIHYFHTLEYVDGWYEFVFPMVVGPRFNPTGTTAGSGAEAQSLKPGERSGRDISLKVDVNAGVLIEEFQCPTHDVTNSAEMPGRLSIALTSEDRIPNRDFVLRYRVAGEEIKSDLRTSPDPSTPGGGYFTLMLYPPRELGNLGRQPLELVFVLDSSGGMAGRPIEQAKAAVARGLQLLQPADSFQIINLSTSASQLGAAPLEATAENIRRGLDYLKNLNGDGPAMVVEGIKAALDFPHDPKRLRFVCFLTDGYIGSETEILAAIHEKLGASRVLSFGIGSSVNRDLIENMARVGRGAVAYLGSSDLAAPVMEQFFQRISHPALTDLSIDWGGLQVSDVYPSALPDLFVGRPVILTGRYSGRGTGYIQVLGHAAGNSIQLANSVVPDSAMATNAGLQSVWARMKIADLETKSIYAPDAALVNQIKQVALDYALVSPFTAMIAVDARDGDAVPVAVPKPDSAAPEK